MKKFFVLMFCIIIITNTVYAMNFSQPKNIAWIECMDHKGFLINYAIKNDVEKKFTDAKTWHAEYYLNGIAQFGDEINPLYFHYATTIEKSRYRGSKMNFGGDNIGNTISYTVGKAYVYQINSDDGKSFYLIDDEPKHNKGNQMTNDNYALLGKSAEGTFKKYFDTYEMVKNFFEYKKYSGSRSGIFGNWVYVKFGKPFTEKNVLIIPYEQVRQFDFKGDIVTEEKGGFYFIWNDDIQDFDKIKLDHLAGNEQYQKSKEVQQLLRNLGDNLEKVFKK